MNDRLTKINNFLSEIEKFKLVERICILSDGITKENDSGHSWQLAMMTWVLKDELGISFDVEKAIKIALIHDLVEIYTGDIVCTSQEGKKTKQKLEMESANKLFKILPKDLQDELYGYWLDYDNGKSIEVKIVKALDKICYLIQYSISGVINWPPEEEDTKEERREYAFRYSGFNNVLVLILDYFLEELDYKKFNYKKEIKVPKRLRQILEFIVEIEKFKLVSRIPCLSDKKTCESDADHSWHLAMMVLTLKDELGIYFDVSHAIKLALIHDLGEIYDGDAWASTSDKQKIKNKLELDAARKLFGVLPLNLKDQFFGYWQEYEENETIEAKVIKGLDKVCYPLQYSVSKTIAFDENEPPREESKKYALPSMEFNPVIISLYDYFTDKVWAEKNRKQIRS